MVACVAIIAVVTGCASTSNDVVVESVGQLEIADLRLLADADGATTLTATVTNTSSVDRAFTVRWAVDEQNREESRLVPALSTTAIGAEGDFRLAGLSAVVGEIVPITIAQGFFYRSTEAAIELDLTVQSVDDGSGGVTE